MRSSATGISARCIQIESEDLVCAVVHYASSHRRHPGRHGASWPGYPERGVRFPGTQGSAIVTGDQLTTWDVRSDSGEPAPISQQAKSGASDPMAISLTPFERQLADFGDACKAGRPSSSSGIEGYRALQLVRSIYTSCSEGKYVAIASSTL